MALFNQGYMEIKVTFRVGHNQCSSKYLQELSSELQLRMYKAGFKTVKIDATGNETIHYFAEPEG